MERNEDLPLVDRIDNECDLFLTRTRESMLEEEALRELRPVLRAMSRLTKRYAERNERDGKSRFIALQISTAEVRDPEGNEALARVGVNQDEELVLAFMHRVGCPVHGPFVIEIGRRTDLGRLRNMGLTPRTMVQQLKTMTHDLLSREIVTMRGGDA